MNFRNALLSATLLALPVAASAQPITGLYIGGDAGVNVMTGQDATFARSPFGGKSKLDTHFGPAGGMSLGYGFGNGLRAEIEGDVMQNSPDSFPGARSVVGSGAEVWRHGQRAVRLRRPDSVCDAIYRRGCRVPGATAQ